MKRYELRFGRHAMRQWQRLDLSIKKQFKKKLEKILQNPHIASARMGGYRDAYRLKLRKAGYRLGYRVHEEQVVVVVITVERRDKEQVYVDFDRYYSEGEL